MIAISPKKEPSPSSASVRGVPELLRAIEDGLLQPDVIISHRMKLADAAEGYRMFDKKLDDCRKVVLTP